MQENVKMMEHLWQLLCTIAGRNLLPVIVPILIYCTLYHKMVRKDLFGKVVLITGASSGLGEKLAHIFHKAGCKLILAARRVDQLERVKSDILQIKCDHETFEPVVIELDLSNLELITKKAEEALKIYGEINILINNGGISYRGNILETSLHVHMNVMTVNYFGQIALTNALLPSLIKCKGHVVTVSSIQGRISIPHRSAYAASKHALQAYMDCLRAEIPDITVTVVNPGYIKTNLSCNAVTGTGEKYGILDKTTEHGYSPEYVAQKIVNAVTVGKKEVTLSPIIPKIAILMRVLTPSLFFYLIRMWRKKSN